MGPAAPAAGRRAGHCWTWTPSMAEACLPRRCECILSSGCSLADAWRNRAGRYCYPSGGPSSAGELWHCRCSSAMLTLAWVPLPCCSSPAGLVAALLLGDSCFSLPTWRMHVPTRWWPSDDLPVELLARRHAPSDSGWPSLGSVGRSGRITLVLCSCPRWVYFTCSSSRRAGGGLNCPLRTRRPDSNGAVTHFLRGVKHGNQ